MKDVNQCLILAAGNGSRIASVSRGVPKPLVPLCGVPLLEHVMVSSEQAGAHAAEVFRVLAQRVEHPL